MTPAPVQLLDLAQTAQAPFQHVFAEGPDHRLRLSVTEGTGPWHHHPNTTETFVVLSGELTLEFRGGERHTLAAGDALCVPAGVSHRSHAETRAVSLSAETLRPQVQLEEA